MKQFDYIIAGAGAAGLTLAYLLMGDEDKKKSLLIIDKDPKSTNDRTWCFWEKDKNLLESIVYKRWQKAQIKTSDWTKDYKLHPFEYKMIRGIDFYDFMRKSLDNSQVTWVQEDIISIDNNGRVKTDKSEYHGSLVFNSCFQYESLQKTTSNTLLQHFKGQVIKTEHPTFNIETATYMDFSIDQEGDCRFGYVLPFDERTALVEYTVFSKDLLSQEVYKDRLNQYIQKITTDQYEVLEEEFGVIPMTDHNFQIRQSDYVFNIGINGGFAKPSTGYTFLRGQQILKKMAQNIQNGLKPDDALPFQSARFKKYDATLLEVLSNGQFTGEEIFGRLFQKNGIHAMFKFLDEETHLAEEMKIMSSTPLLQFGIAFMKTAFQKNTSK